jgi:hypothetical protein
METLFPQPSFDEQLSSLVYTIHGLNRFGVTSVIDCGSRGYPDAHVTAEVLMRDGASTCDSPSWTCSSAAPGWWTRRSTPSPESRS